MVLSFIFFNSEGVRVIVCVLGNCVCMFAALFSLMNDDDDDDDDDSLHD